MYTCTRIFRGHCLIAVAIAVAAPALQEAEAEAEAMCSVCAMPCM